MDGEAVSGKTGGGHMWCCWHGAPLPERMLPFNDSPKMDRQQIPKAGSLDLF